MDNKDLVSIDTILEWLRKSVEEKQPIPPSTFLDAAAKLIVLLADLDDDLIKAKFEAERLQRKRDRIVEFIRISKKRVDLKEWE